MFWQLVGHVSDMVWEGRRRRSASFYWRCHFAWRFAAAVSCPCPVWPFLSVLFGWRLAYVVVGVSASPSLSCPSELASWLSRALARQKGGNVLLATSNELTGVFA